MNSDAIQIVTAALESSLETAFTEAGIAGGLFVGPLDDPQAEGAAAVLFLYRVAVNADLRNTERFTPGANEGDPPVLLSGALPLDLYYLLTASSSEVGSERFEALRVLGCAMQALNDAPFLTGHALGGDTVRISLDPITSEEMSRIWTLFPTANFRTSVVYLASPVWIDSATLPRPAPPVTREPHRVGPLVN